MYKITIEQNGKESDLQLIANINDAMQAFECAKILYDYQDDQAIFRLYNKSGLMICRKELRYYPN